MTHTMGMRLERLENLLGAAAVAVSDAQSSAMTRRTGLKHSAAAVVLTLGQHEPLTISDLARIAGLTHSAMVRLIDGLERNGLITRRRGHSLREVLITLSDLGRDVFSELRQAQSAVLGSLVNGLSDGEQRSLEFALSHILASLTHDRLSADHICRFCCENVCDQDHCPVERKAVELSAT